MQLDPNTMLFDLHSEMSVTGDVIQFHSDFSRANLALAVPRVFGVDVLHKSKLSFNSII